MDVGREGGDLNGEVESRERTVGADVAEAGFGFVGVEFRDGVEDLEVAIQKHVSLGFADDGLAEQVDGRSDAQFVVLPDLLDQVLAGFTGDELSGHIDDLGLDGTGNEGGGERGGGEAGLEGGVELDGLVAEIFLEMPDDLGGGIEGGEDVDEAEELGLEGGVLHGPVHEAGVGAFLGEQGRGRLLVHEGKELFALGANSGFDLGIRR